MRSHDTGDHTTLPMARGLQPPKKRLAKSLTPLSSPPRGRPLQESFVKLVEACNDTSINMDRWLSRLESCRWLSHVKAALSTACLAAQCMDR